MSLLEKWIEKIKVKWLQKAIASMLSIMIFICMIGFFALPFIKYSESSKIIFLCFWIFCTAIFSAFAFAFYKYDFRNNKKEIEEYEKDKVVYLVGRIGIAIYFVGILLLIFLVRNNFLSLSTTATIGFCVMGLLLLGIVITLLTQYKNNYKKMAKDTIKFLYAFFVIVFCSVLLFTGVMIHENDNYPEHFSQFLICFGAFPLLLVGIYFACKMFLSKKMFNEKSDGLPISIVLFIAIGVITCIILKYVVSDTEMQQIMTTIFAAILGGAITLLGVAWTIKDNADKLRKERKLSIKPYLDIRQNHYTRIEDLPVKDAVYVEVGNHIVCQNSLPEEIARLSSPPVENKTSNELVAHTMLLTDFMTRHYLMSCNVENCGAGNAIDLKIKINDFELNPMCVTTSTPKNVVFIISDALISDNKKRSCKISISYTYTDISYLGKYQQTESFILTKSESGELQLVQFSEDFLTAPIEL